MEIIKSRFSDVVYDYSSEIPKTNVPHVYGHADFHTWGYRGIGPTDFAFNILYYFSGNDEKLASTYCLDFVVEVVSKIKNRSSGRIPARLINLWIKKKKESGVTNHGPYKLSMAGEKIWCVTQQNKERRA